MVVSLFSLILYFVLLLTGRPSATNWIRMISVAACSDLKRMTASCLLSLKLPVFLEHYIISILGEMRHMCILLDETKLDVKKLDEMGWVSGQTQTEINGEWANHAGSMLLMFLWRWYRCLCCHSSSPRIFANGSKWLQLQNYSRDINRSLGTRPSQYTAHTVLW